MAEPGGPSFRKSSLVRKKNCPPSARGRLAGVVPRDQDRHPGGKLAEGIEPTTAGLQNPCSTVELRQRSLFRGKSKYREMAQTLQAKIPCQAITCTFPPDRKSAASPRPAFTFLNFNDTSRPAKVRSPAACSVILSPGKGPVFWSPYRFFLPFFSSRIPPPAPTPKN